MTTNTGMCIYNKFTNPNTKKVIFKKHYIDNVFWDDSKGINLDKGFDKENEVNVYIPKDTNDFRNYVMPKQYNGINWTIAKGDIIVKGNTNINEVEKLSELDKVYNDVFTITMVDDKDFGSFNMQHFEIRGK